MSRPLLIIISGPPCTGKTTLGKKIAKKYNLPFISKDDIKELLFDNLGCKDRGWSKKMGVVSYSILYYLIESLLKSSTSFVVESNFKPEYDTKKFLKLKKKYNFKSLQMQCKTEGKVLFERFKKRSESGDRHPGHVDHKNYKEFEKVLLSGKHKKLDIGGDVIEVDTTYFDKIDYGEVFKEIKRSL